MVRVAGAQEAVQGCQVAGAALVEGVVVDVQDAGAGGRQGPPAVGEVGELLPDPGMLFGDERRGQRGAFRGVEVVEEADVRAPVPYAEAVAERLAQAGAEYVGEVGLDDLPHGDEVEVEPVEEVGALDARDAAELVGRLAVVAEPDTDVVHGRLRQTPVRRSRTPMLPRLLR
ncbi:hypothetical protein ACN24M_06970 [Streptomyces microflavus]